MDFFFASRQKVCRKSNVCVILSMTTVTQLSFFSSVRKITILYLHILEYCNHHITQIKYHSPIVTATMASIHGTTVSIGSIAATTKKQIKSALIGAGLQQIDGTVLSKCT